MLINLTLDLLADCTNYTKQMVQFVAKLGGYSASHFKPRQVGLGQHID